MSAYTKRPMSSSPPARWTSRPPFVRAERFQGLLPVAPSTRTRCRVPMYSRCFSAEISFARTTRASKRRCFTSRGVGSGMAAAFVPARGEKIKVNIAS